MNLNGRLSCKRDDSKSVVAQVEKMILRLSRIEFNNRIGEERPPHKNPIKGTESTHNKFILQRDLLSGKKFGHKTLDGTK